MYFIKILTEFFRLPKTDDPTLDFFNFLQENYPVIWDNFNCFYGDDDTQEGISPRLARFDWDTLVKKGNFSLFLFSIHHNWEYFSDEENTCEVCLTPLEYTTREHALFNAYEGHISFSFYEHKGFDGAFISENYLCSKCANY